jgi:pimeloyl-ACP methyl ester carboxylesterase
MGAVRHVRAGVLDIGYHEFGQSGGPVVLLLHGFPYDVHSYVEVAPVLAARGFRVIVPHLRGHGPTRFADASTPRSGQQAAIGADLLALLDALGIDRAVLAGYDWGGRAACVVAALHPERCIGLVSVNSYLIQDIAKAAFPAPARVKRGFWYQFYFTTERGRAGLAAHSEDIARIMWADNSPTWRFDDYVRPKRRSLYQSGLCRGGDPLLPAPPWAHKWRTTVRCHRSSACQPSADPSSDDHTRRAARRRRCRDKWTSERR